MSFFLTGTSGCSGGLGTERGKRELTRNWFQPGAELNIETGLSPQARLEESEPACRVFLNSVANGGHRLGRCCLKPELKRQSEEFASGDLGVCAR